MTGKRDIQIDLCDESGQAVISWIARRALPIRLDAPTFDANSNDVAIETMEFIAHDLEVDYNPA
jgi:phage tail-like protein